MVCWRKVWSCKERRVKVGRGSLVTLGLVESSLGRLRCA